LEDGLEHGVLNKQTGHDFMKAVLEQGGATDMLTLFARFRGRTVNTQALLAQRGITN
jgi:oligopeptidase A